jgi:hypothetical protein
MNDCQVVAACDLDKNHLQAALDTINGHYGNQDCKGLSRLSRTAGAERY